MTRNDSWWADRTVYQIYPRSFADGSGDGIGDLPGIISRLDHLADLGIGIVWISPVCCSPMADSGYDISDFRDIAPVFGTLADFDRLVGEANRRDIAVMIDLAINHTSSEHAWFREASTDRNSPFHDYYYWRDPAPGGGPPNDWQARFGGPAWTYVAEVGRYYFGVFCAAEPDLNWQNPALRQEIYAMMRWWLDRGVRGFRFDVIDLIGKDLDRGEIEEGPYLHDWLREMHEAVMTGRQTVTVGESWNVTKETALLYVGRDRRELDMVFQFEHIVRGWDEVHGKWSPRPVAPIDLKRVWTEWQQALAADGWMALFLSNHDLPRAVSRYGDSGRWRERCAKAIATVLHLMRGTPFVFQGEEIGMVNAAFDDIHQYRDMETLNIHREWNAMGLPEDEFLKGAAIHARDNARTPMQWDASPGAGFTAGEPWIAINPDHRQINVAAQASDPESVLWHYRRLIALRREHGIIVHGRFVPCLEAHEQVWAYAREWENQRLSVLCNFSSEPASADVPAALAVRGKGLIHTAERRDEIARGRIELVPWEAVAVLGELS